MVEGIARRSALCGLASGIDQAIHKHNTTLHDNIAYESIYLNEWFILV